MLFSKKDFEILINDINSLISEWFSSNSDEKKQIVEKINFYGRNLALIAGYWSVINNPKYYDAFSYLHDELEKDKNNGYTYRSVPITDAGTTIIESVILDGNDL